MIDQNDMDCALNVSISENVMSFHLNSDFSISTQGTVAKLSKFTQSLADL